MSEPSRHGDTLSSDDWELVKDMVFSCLPLDRPARERWLDEQRPSERVRREVERLLAASQTSVGFMDVSAPRRVLDLPAEHPEHIGHFRIEHVLGAGGMGVVYAGVDERLGRPVAIKVLQPDAAADDTRRKRLIWDARAASTLNHPNIVCVYEAGEAAGVAYVAMELVSGNTLAELLDREALPQPRALLLATQVAAGLEAAHAQGIVHRDLKPSNVMISDTGVAKLVDFGLAKSVGGDIPDGHAPTTIEGRLAGTVAYMSPEQAEGGDVDFRSDIFSFGSLLYEMLTRQRAFEGGSTVSILARVIHADPAAPRALTPALDSRLDDIVQRCLRKDRERRFQSMAEVRVRLQEVIDEPIQKPTRVSRAPRVWLWGLGAAAAAGIGAIVTAAVLGWGARPGVPATLSRLTWDGGLTTAPAISRDGTMLAYASDRSGRGDLDIWIQKVGGSDPMRLTTDANDDSAPAISPDGLKVAYRSERGGGGVYVIPSLGGSERLVAPGCRDPKYSPDGQTIACWKGDVGRAFYPGSARIFLVLANGQVRPFRTDFAADGFPLWLPDGSGLIFLGRKIDANGESVLDWWVASESGVARATGARNIFKDQNLAPPAGSFHLRPEAWLELPSTLLFTARREDSTSVWGLNATPGGDVRGPARPITTSSAVEAMPTAPGGSAAPALVFASLSTETRLRRVPLVSSSPHAAAEPLLPNLAQIGGSSISADGRLLVFSARQPTGYRVISVDPATATQDVVATVDSSDFVRAVVSGDGKTIVYGGTTIVDGGTRKTGYRMRLRGLPEQICTGCGWPTHLNYDGTQALFESGESDERLMLWSGGTVRPLIGGADPANRMQFSGRFSPDGRWVALCLGARESSERRIFVVPNGGGRALKDQEWVPVSEDQATDREPVWSPDGKRLFFISERDGFRCVWARPMDPRTGRPTGAAEPVAHFHYARELLRAPVTQYGAIGLTASSDSLIFTVAQSTGNLWWRHDPAAR